MASRNVGCFLRFAGEVLFSLLAIDDDLNAKAMKMSAQLRKVGNAGCLWSSNISSMRLLQFGSDKTPHEGRKGWWDSCTRTAFGTERRVGKRHLF